MTKEELIKLSRENLRKSKQGSLCECYDEAFIKGYELSKKRIAELEYQLTHRNCVDCSNHSSNLRIRNLDLEKENAELKEELKKWKDEWQEQVQKANDEGYARTLQTIQLTKAKEIIERLLKTSCNSDVLNLLPNCSEVLRVRVEAEQFLSEVEKK